MKVNEADKLLDRLDRLQVATPDEVSSTLRELQLCMLRGVYPTDRDGAIGRLENLRDRAEIAGRNEQRKAALFFLAAVFLFMVAAYLVFAGL